ncbi:MAG: FUSC family protein [Dokdonella sp.]
MAWLRGAGLDWLFVAKASFAILLTGWLAMRFSLEQPGTAMMTVAIVIHPQSGMVIAKSFYRTLGTLAGAVMALLIVAAFPQERAMFLLSMALWIGLCAGGASLYRNFKSYGFVLAGYTAAIIALPVVNQPQDVFQSAVMRVSEVTLGIFVAGVVSDALFPQRLGDVLRESVRSQFSSFIAFVRDSLRGALPRGDLERAHLRGVREVVQVETQLSSVVFEDAGVRQRSPRVRRLNHAFMAASTSYQSLHHLLNRLQDESHSRVLRRLMTLAGDLGEALGVPGSEPRMASQTGALAEGLAALRARQPARIASVREGLAERSDLLDFDTGAELLARIADELQDYTAAYAVLATPQAVRQSAAPLTPFVHANDWIGAALATLRGTVTMLATGAFWIATAWPEGAGMMLIATIFSCLMATVPDPLRAIRYMLFGYALGMLAALVCVYTVLVRMDGFELFAAGLLPFMLPGLYLRARPVMPGVGAGFMLAFLYTVAAQNPMKFDALHSLNNSLGQLMGIATAGVSFMVFSGVSDSPWLLRRLLRKLRLQLVRACSAPLPGLLARFESATRDVAAQIVAHTRSASDESRNMLAWSLSVQEAGRAVVELRTQLATADVPTSLHDCIDRALAALAALYAKPNRERYALTRNLVSTALDEAQAFPVLLGPLHLIRLALLDVGSLLANEFDVPPRLGEEIAHAA